MNIQPNGKSISQQDRDGFMNVLANEKIEVIWNMFKLRWHSTQKDPATIEMIENLIKFAENRKNNVPCCG